MPAAQLFTIGSTQSSAEHFFNRLKQAGVRRVVDVRLNNSSQLAGFAKGGDLPFFLHRIAGIAYVHEPMFAPTDDLVRLGREGKWPEWETGFRRLMTQRGVTRRFTPADFADACLLCAEAKPHNCHRRIVAELLAGEGKTPMTVVHL